VDEGWQLVEGLGDQGFESPQRSPRSDALSCLPIPRQSFSALRHRPVMNMGMTMATTTTRPMIT
jgi:hypothetical protein